MFEYLRRAGEPVEEVLYERDLCAGLQIPGGFPQYGDKHGPDLSLEMELLCHKRKCFVSGVNSRNKDISREITQHHSGEAE